MRPSAAVTTVMPAWFQSAPDREAGRCPAAHPMRDAAMMFQSAPDREAGRCVAGTAGGVQHVVVSIRARP